MARGEPVERDDFWLNSVHLHERRRPPFGGRSQEVTPKRSFGYVAPGDVTASREHAPDDRLRIDRSDLLSISLRRDQASSKRSRFITLFQAATKSFTNFSFESAQA
jgi:hypothetical protein